MSVLYLIGQPLLLHPCPEVIHPLTSQAAEWRILHCALLPVLPPQPSRHTCRGGEECLVRNQPYEYTLVVHGYVESTFTTDDSGACHILSATRIGQTRRVCLHSSSIAAKVCACSSSLLHQPSSACHFDYIVIMLSYPHSRCPSSIRARCVRLYCWLLVPSRCVYD